MTWRIALCVLPAVGLLGLALMLAGCAGLRDAAAVADFVVDCAIRPADCN